MKYSGAGSFMVSLIILNPKSAVQPGMSALTAASTRRTQEAAGTRGMTPAGGRGRLRG